MFGRTAEVDCGDGITATIKAIGWRQLDQAQIARQVEAIEMASAIPEGMIDRAIKQRGGETAVRAAAAAGPVRDQYSLPKLLHSGVVSFRNGEGTIRATDDLIGEMDRPTAHMLADAILRLSRIDVDGTAEVDRKND